MNEGAPGSTDFDFDGGRDRKERVWKRGVKGERCSTVGLSINEGFKDQRTIGPCLSAVVHAER